MIRGSLATARNRAFMWSSIGHTVQRAGSAQTRHDPRRRSPRIAEFPHDRRSDRCKRCGMKRLAISLALLFTATAGAQQPPGKPATGRAAESLGARARRVQREAIVIDTHIDTTGHIERTDWSFTDRHE